jgi:hypothetical protein
MFESLAKEGPFGWTYQTWLIIAIVILLLIGGGFGIYANKGRIGAALKL